MEDRKQTSFTFEIDNFWDKEALIRSPNFFSGGCQWFVDVYPRGCGIEDHLSTFLCVANPESLLLGWKRRAILSLILLNVSGKRLYRTYRDGPPCKTFCAQFPAWGWADAMPLEMLQENGFMEKNKLIVQVNVQVVEVVDEAEVTGKETLDVNGFQVLYSEVGQVTTIFAKHPDVALNFIPKSQLVKTVYMKLLMFLIEKLNKPPRSFIKNELSNARMELIDLTKAGFKLDWLKEKLDEISLERKKANGDGSLSSYGFRVQELEEQVKNLNLKLDTEKVKSAKVLSLEQTVSDLRDELSKEKTRSTTTTKDVLEGVIRSWEVLDYPDLTLFYNNEHQVRVLYSSNRMIDVEAVPLGKMVYLTFVYGDPVQKLREQVWERLTRYGLARSKPCFDLNWLKIKLFEVSLEWKKENIDNSRVQELEEQVKNLNLELETEKLKSAAKVLSLEQTVSELRDELSKQKGKSTPEDELEAVVRSWELLNYADSVMKSWNK
ncbi:unnamed protein product [Brassica oleracea]